MAEIAKMEDLRHPNVMSLIGVLLDIRSGLSIVMPYMANGNLLEYLKRERNAIYLDDSVDVDTVSEHACKLCISLSSDHSQFSDLSMKYGILC